MHLRSVCPCHVCPCHVLPLSCLPFPTCRRYAARPSKASIMDTLEGDALYGVVPVLAALTAGVRAAAITTSCTAGVNL